MILFYSMENENKKILIEKLGSLLNTIPVNSKISCIRHNILKTVYSLLFDIAEKRRQRTRIASQVLSFVNIQHPKVYSNTAASLCRYFRYDEKPHIPIKEFYGFYLYLKDWDSIQDPEKFSDRMAAIIILAMLNNGHLTINRNLYHFRDEVDLNIYKFNGPINSEIAIMRDSFGIFRYIKGVFEKYNVCDKNADQTEEYTDFIGVVSTMALHAILRLSCFMLEEMDLDNKIKGTHKIIIELLKEEYKNLTNYLYFNEHIVIKTNSGCILELP